MKDHWLYISYINRGGQSTKYYIGITDINTVRETMLCEIFNPYKGTECMDRMVNISIDGIQDAVVMDESFSPISDEVLQKLSDTKSDLYKYLEADTMDNNILQY